MRLTFVQPQQSSVKDKCFFCLEPHTIAKLYAITPQDIICNLYDERIEKINFEKPTDLVSISINTINAKRGYEIAAEYQRRGVKVVMGGLHASLIPEETEKYADAVMVGEGEDTWLQMLKDFKNNCLKKRYEASCRHSMQGLIIDRSIFKGKRYLPLAHVETTRGCYYHCKFCSMAAMFKSKVVFRPIDEVIADIKNIKTRMLSFTDDNVGDNLEYRTELFTRMIPLKKKWFGYITLKSLLNEEFVKLLHDSGCLCIFTGFETINPEILKQMNKGNNATISDYKKAIENCTKYDIPIAAGAVVGYPGDTKENAKAVYDFVNSYQFYFCTISNAMPYPGTTMYKEMEENGTVVKDWWLKDIDPWNSALCRIPNFTEKELANLGGKYFKDYLSYKNIFHRFWISKYRLRPRLKILFFNLFLRHFGNWIVR